MNRGLKDCEEIKDCMERKCVECDIPVFERNNYFCGKLMVERDFWCDQHYHMGKRRRHNKNAHGWGTLCGLKIEEHPIPECRDKYVILKPGAALDCCGREIVVKEEQRMPLPEKKENEVEPPNTIYFAIKYKECFTEPVPTLFSDCGCDDKCEPNRIKEAFELKVFRQNELEKEQPKPYDMGGDSLEDRPCNEIYRDVIEGCPQCSEDILNKWIILAAVENYQAGNRVINDEKFARPFEKNLDNFTYRRLVPSTDILYEMIRCIMAKGAGEQGPPGPPGKGIKEVKAETVDSSQPADAIYDETAEELTLKIPKGEKGDKGDRGPPGEGLDKDLTHIVDITWKHAGEYKGGEFRELELVVTFDDNVKKETVNENTFLLMFGILYRKAGQASTYQYKIVDGINRIKMTNSKTAVYDLRGVWDLIKGQIVFEDNVSIRVKVLIILKGDHIRDAKDKAVDVNANFIPTDQGLVMKPSGNGVPGDDFESWFEIISFD